MAETFAPEIPKRIIGEPFKLLRLKKNTSKLDIGEDGPLFENIGNGINEFITEVRCEQEEFYPTLKNEFLFLKEVLESQVKHLKVVVTRCTPSTSSSTDS
jgi:hypothetical protein